jgi:hypothetical protein
MSSRTLRPPQLVKHRNGDDIQLYIVCKEHKKLAFLVFRNRAHGNSERQRSIVDASSAYTVASKLKGLSYLEYIFRQVVPIKLAYWSNIEHFIDFII